MNTNKKSSSSHLFPNKINYQNNSNAEIPKNRPISALLSLKILQRQNLNKSLLQLSCKRDISFEEIHRHKQNFNKLYVLPELEAQNQSNLQYINDLYGFYDTIINEKKEEFLPFYIINPKRREIIQKFICLNRRTKTNNVKHEVYREKKKKQIIKAKLPTQPFRVKDNESNNKTDMELMELLRKEEEINKNNFHTIFALTQKENPRNFPKQKLANEKKSNETNIKTVNMNEINLESSSLAQTQKSEKINFFQYRLKEIKSKTSTSLHCTNKNDFINFKTQVLENLNMQKKNFNFSKPSKITMDLEPKKKPQVVMMRLDLKRKEIAANENNQEKQQTSRRTENLQGWNENIIFDDENF